MLNCKILAVFLVVAVACRTASCYIQANFYEENVTYRKNPWCKPSKLDKGIKCSAVTDPIEAKGGIYSNFGLHYMPLASAYYVARLADAMGYQDCCPTNTTFLTQLDIQIPWSGAHGAIAVDGACGYDRFVLRRCVFPTTAKYPVLCTGSEGNAGTYGKRLETLSYISVLEGANLRWALFIHCWRAKTPENPNSQEIATSFNVFNLDAEFSAADRELVIKELERRGFNTDPYNIIESDYTTTKCSCHKGNHWKQCH